MLNKIFLYIITISIIFTKGLHAQEVSVDNEISVTEVSTNNEISTDNTFSADVASNNNEEELSEEYKKLQSELGSLVNEEFASDYINIMQKNSLFLNIAPGTTDSGKKFADFGNAIKSMKEDGIFLQLFELSLKNATENGTLDTTFFSNNLDGKEVTITMLEVISDMKHLIGNNLNVKSFQDFIGLEIGSKTISSTMPGMKLYSKDVIPTNSYKFHGHIDRVGFRAAHPNIGVGFGDNGTGNYNYLAFGRWDLSPDHARRAYEEQTTLLPGSEDAIEIGQGDYIYGQVTDSAKMPIVGTGVYNGEINGGANGVSGDISMTADFGAGSIGGSVSDIIKNSTSWVNDLNINGQISGGNLNGTLLGENASGSIIGSFFGDDASEAGGLIEISKNQGETANALWMAKQ